MTSSQDHVDYLADIAESMAKAQQFVLGMSFDAFAAMDTLVRARRRTGPLCGGVVRVPG